MTTCVGAFLWRAGSILLGLRARDRSVCPGTWDAIGGHVEGLESIPDALERELYEEIRVTPLDYTELAILDGVEPDTNGQVRYHMFLVTRWKGEGPVMRGTEHSEICWFPVSEAMRLKLAHPGYLQLLRDLDTGPSN